MFRAVIFVSLLALGTGGSALSAGTGGQSAEFSPAQYGPGYPGHDGRSPSYGMGMPPYGSGEMMRPPGDYGADAERYGMGAPRPSIGEAPRSAAAVEAARRLYTVADTVALGGAALCDGRKKPQSGLRAWTESAMVSAGARARGRHSHAVTIFSVAHGGPAVRAGLAPGDRILSIDGERIPDLPGSMETYLAKMETALARRTPIAVGYRRAGRDAVAELVPTEGCDIKIAFSNSSMVNALTDGQSIMVMRGLIETLKRDDELALVVGHELSHNVLGHFARGRTLGANGPFTAGASSKLRQFESEADYVGLYFVALAGYDYAGAIESSHRMAAIAPMGDRGSSTHPSQLQRYAALAKTVREIRAKLTEGRPLRPNLRTGRAGVEGAEPGAVQ